MSEIESNPEKRIALFQRKEIRRVIHNNEWWFAIIDVIAALTDSVNPKGYFTDMRRRDPQLTEALKGGGNLPPPFGLEFDTAGGRQMLQCWNTEGIFRLIQSIPSPKAEPFKRENLRDCSGGHPACRRGRASCRPEEARAVRRLKNLWMTLESSCAGPAGLEARLYGRQDARRYTGNARRDLEKKSGRKVVTSGNYLALAQKAKKSRQVK